MYLPECDSSLKPYVGQIFGSLEDGEKFYKEYGVACGFDIRLGSNKRSADGTIIWKYIFCNREGEKEVSNDSNKDKSNKIQRRKVSRRFSCMARLILRYSALEGYVVKTFIEEHTHPLLPEAYRHFMKFNRKLDVTHEKFVLNCARANIGAVKSYRLFKEMVGSYSNVGCDVVDFKNFSRDMRAYAIGSDAQMMLDKLIKRRDLCSAFCVEYCVDDNDKLKHLFWSDSISRRNYHLFGETITFDATYGMNRCFKFIFLICS